MAIADSPRRAAYQSTSDESQNEDTTTDRHRPSQTARQPDLFGHEPEPRFDGATVEPLDVPRLTGQLARVADLMADGRWRRLRQIADEASCSEASASARLRDFRKDRFGAHTVERRRDARCPGLWSYRVQLRTEVKR